MRLLLLLHGSKSYITQIRFSEAGKNHLLEVLGKTVVRDGRFYDLRADAAITRERNDSTTFLNPVQSC